MSRLLDRLAAHFGYEPRDSWRRVVIPPLFAAQIKALPDDREHVVSLWSSRGYIDRLQAEEIAQPTSYVHLSG